MNFFRAQDEARANTTKLVVLFVLAVLSLIVLVNLFIILTLGLMDMDVLATGDIWRMMDWRLFSMVGAGVTVVVLLGTVFKLVQLSGGGHTVAEMLGGRLVPTDTYDYHEKRLINVVTEMAIASGTPVPPVYVMDNENGINAFAAGYMQKDAVIAVTRGTLEMLTRDELQGVIAHEFSHVFNGDMRLNIRLIGILNGILVIGRIGYIIMRGSTGSRRSRERGALPLIFVGLGLMIIGYVGTFFGNLIKSAVSRQREYLADASAVQFTRNPEGIAGALKKIGGNAYGGRVLSPAADEISHAFFAGAVSHFMEFMMATHPPLEDRIRTVQPSWDGEFIKPQKIAAPVTEERERPPPIDQQTLFTLATVLAAQESIETIGHPDKRHFDFARQMLTMLPDELLDAAHETYSARAVVYFLLLSEQDDVRQRQLDHLLHHADDGVAGVTLRLSNFQQQMRIEYRLSLLNITLSPLQQMTRAQYDQFSMNMDALIKADDKMELFEWAIQKIITHTLDARFDDSAAERPVYKSCAAVEDDCRLLLSTLWYAGKNPDEAREAFDEVVVSLGIPAGLLTRQAIRLESLNGALDRLNLLYPLKKPELLKACAAVISLDGVVRPIESELFRAVAAILDCPMPPILAD